jgi:hypothetical protein
VQCFLIDMDRDFKVFNKVGKQAGEMHVME